MNPPFATDGSVSVVTFEGEAVDADVAGAVIVESDARLDTSTDATRRWRRRRGRDCDGAACGRRNLHMNSIYKSS